MGVDLILTYKISNNNKEKGKNALRVLLVWCYTAPILCIHYPIDYTKGYLYGLFCAIIAFKVEKGR